MNCRVCNSALDSSGYCSNCGFDEGLAYEYYPTLQSIEGLSISERRKNWEEKIAAENSLPASNVKCEFNNDTIVVSGSGSIAASDLQCVIPGSTSAKPDFDKIKKVIIGNGITEIEDDCFANFPALESVVLPDGLLAIGKSAFCLCHSLATIAIPDTCTSIGNNAFSFCRSLRSIHLPRKLTTIESHLFWGCESLASIIIPDRVSSIGDRAFAQCGSLTSITIPDSVLEISHSSFLSCRNLKDIYYSGTVEEWNALTLQNNGPYFPDVVMHFGTTSKGFQSKPSGVSEPPRKSINAPATASSTHSEENKPVSPAQSDNSVFIAKLWTIIIIAVYSLLTVCLQSGEWDEWNKYYWAFRLAPILLPLLSFTAKPKSFSILLSKLGLGFAIGGCFVFLVAPIVMLLLSLLEKFENTSSVILYILYTALALIFPFLLIPCFIYGLQLSISLSNALVDTIVESNSKE